MSENPAVPVDPIPDEADRFETRFAGLEAASRLLSADVQALTSSLMVVAELQRQQREQAIKQAEIEATVALQKEQVDEREVRTRKAFKNLGLALAIILPLISIGVYLSLLNHVNNMIDNNNKQAYASCSARNASQLQNAARERSLASYETNVHIKDIHLKSAYSQEHTLSNCSRWLKKH